MNLMDVIPVEAGLGESPLWDERNGLLYWIDIAGREIGALSVTTRGWATLPTPYKYGSLALTSTPGRLLAATAQGLEVIRLTDGGVEVVRSIGDPESDVAGNRFNDGKTDRRGRFWTGTMDDAEVGRRTGSMYRLDPDGTISRAWGDVGIPNGLCFSPDGRTMYTADSDDGELREADYDPDSGQPGPRRVLARCEGAGVPDGSTVDAAGGIWNAEWGASRVVRYLPDGSVDAVIDVPATQPTCPAFGGPGLDLLFVTTAKRGNDPGPHGGSILVYEVDVAGIAETPYAG
jgi:L-arabinonolactonase